MMYETEDMKEAATKYAAGQEAASMLLLGGAAINLARIATAVEKLMQSNPDPRAPETLRDLTPEERDTIIALREGRLMVMVVPTERHPATRD
jgi:hypothetical protein